MRTKWLLISTIEFLVAGLTISIGNYGRGSGNVLAMMMVGTGLTIGGCWLWLREKNTPKPLPLQVHRDVEWEIHNGMECDACGLFHADDPHPLDQALQGHPKGCKCQPCLRRRADQLGRKAGILR